MAPVASLALGFLALLIQQLLVSGIIYNADVVVYESTPSGIMAAIAASNTSNNSLNVILLSTRSHVGGMVSGGLSYTDSGNNGAIGGYTRNFFIRNGAIYNQSIEFKLEPHNAYNIFISMLNEANVSLIIDSPVAISNIDSDNNIISSIETITGNTYFAKIFIDASYEGDLFAASGVTYHLGREANDEYNETHNGRSLPRGLNNFGFYVNPYDSNGNLLPLLQPFDNIEPGSADNKIQAMNYRMCVTKNVDNRIPFCNKPSTYNASRFELLRRLFYINPPTQDNVLCGAGKTMNDKYDLNNCGPISSDYIGHSSNYINNTYSARLSIETETRDYTLEWLYFLCTDSIIPPDVRNLMNNSWGFCADEWIDNNYFPPVIYIREGRRIINSDFVFTELTAEHNADYKFYYKNQSIGLGDYNFDTHNTQRFACFNSSQCYSHPANDNNTGCGDILNNCSYAWNEGDVECGDFKNDPYQIPYMVLTPTYNEINNLLVTGGVSASHIAYSTLRMAPQYMIMGHSAGTAAAILIKNNNYNNVQNISFIELKETLLKQGQYLIYNQTNSSKNHIDRTME